MQKIAVIDSQNTLHEFASLIGRRVSMGAIL